MCVRHEPSHSLKIDELHINSLTMKNCVFNIPYSNRVTFALVVSAVVLLDVVALLSRCSPVVMATQVFDGYIHVMLYFEYRLSSHNKNMFV